MLGLRGGAGQGVGRMSACVHGLSRERKTAC